MGFGHNIVIESNFVSRQLFDNWESERLLKFVVDIIVGIVRNMFV